MVSSDKTLTVAPKIPGPAALPALWIRTAAGPQVGFGHLKRCFIIGEALEDCCIPLMLLDHDDLWIKNHVEQKNWRWLPGLDNAWGLMRDPVGILIDTRLTDGLDRLISSAKSHGIPVISIHDLGLSLLDSDILVDGSIVSLPDEIFPKSAERFTGTDFMVLDPAYGRLHQRQKRIRGTVQSIFINMGGGDSERYFLRVLEGLKLWSHEVDVFGVPGFVSWGQERLRCRDWGRVHFRWEARNIEKFLFESDLAITAGGTSAYEALCAGTPLLALSCDPLQQSTVSTLAAKGACIDLGSGDAVDPLKLSGTLSRINGDPERRKYLSRQGRRLIDGRGAERVAQIIRRTISRDSAVWHMN